ncbi:MAG TPA: type III-A CRISPR-associated protein Cas10/Csm1 [Candidatus Hydrogenedentes bacterium]|nr:type III-A CRISPR-associated protein Cas10/Csm1 [Candidatus Hydrogenedentota bacterium]HRT20254.1 type III-A CRISPR-associated protein Cas10/Csm1 [Candidatus Hydrogenedentota bacterium]HRT64317.1 type III-A CRISPR-associated protein Cas10/Csm1 [Candidatus Hydrogenedentota bacterium]
MLAQSLLHLYSQRSGKQDRGGIMKEHVERVATAALLHDIGKFWSRTGLKKPFNSQEKEHFGTYDHALWSAHFVEAHLHDAELANWVRSHHDPDQSREAMLISLADWLSSAERECDAEQERSTPEKACLYSVLAGLKQDTPQPYALPIIPHGAFDERAFMPNEGQEGSARQYCALWESLEAAISGIESVVAPHGTWLALMRRFTSRIPAATPTRVGAYIPDISLYEHSRTTAALAACFAADDVSKERASAIRTHLSDHKLDGPAKEPICRLVCGDLSGIQDFLYAIPRKGAAKTLKARSFLLQLVCEACATYLCEQAGLPSCCVIYNSGGRFYLLFPLNADIDGIAAQLSKHILDGFHGALSLLVGDTTLAPKDFVIGEVFSGKWREAGEQANLKKAQKLSLHARQDYDTLFGSLDEDVFPVTVYGGDEEETLTDFDESLRDFGRRLRDARWLVRTKPSDNPDPVNALFAPLGFGYHLASSTSEAPDRNQILEVIQLGAFDPAETRKAIRPPDESALSYRMLAKSWPRGESDWDVATFEDLAARSTGAKKFAIFRADVDNLGALFGSGLKERATIGRMAMLSAALTDFFEGYVDHLAATRYGNTVGVIYTGGDDLFVVGAWDAVIDFAIELREAFTQYTGGNPVLTFSGGVAIVEDHLPLRFAADLAREAEETAKGYERDGKTKNALCLFGMPIGFDEMDRFTEFQALLEKVMAKENGRKPLPSGFLRRLFEVWEVYQRERKAIEKRVRGAPVNMDELRRTAQWQRWRWMLVYGLREFAKKAKDWENEIKEIQDRILDANRPIEDRLGVPLRWTELLLKKEEDRS